MKTIGDLLTRDLSRKIEEIIQVDQADEQSVYAEITEYVATDSIRDQYTDLFKAVAEAPADPHESVGVWVSGFFGRAKARSPRTSATPSKTGGSRHAISPTSSRDNWARRISDLLDLINAQFPPRSSSSRSPRRGTPGKVTERIAELMYTVLLRELGYAEDLDIAELEIELEAEGRLDQFVRSAQKSQPGLDGSSAKGRRSSPCLRHPASIYRPETSLRRIHGRTLCAIEMPRSRSARS